MPLPQLLLVFASPLLLAHFTLFRDYRGWLATEYPPEATRGGRYPIIFWISASLPILAAGLCVGLLVPNIPPFPALDVDVWQWVAVGLIVPGLFSYGYARAAFRHWGPNQRTLRGIIRHMRRQLLRRRPVRRFQGKSNAAFREDLSVYVRLARNRLDKHDRAGWLAVLDGFSTVVEEHSMLPRKGSTELDSMLTEALRELDRDPIPPGEMELALVLLHGRIAYAARDGGLERLEAQAVANLVTRVTINDGAHHEDKHRTYQQAFETLAQLLIKSVPQLHDTSAVSVLNQVYASLGDEDEFDSHSTVSWVRSFIELCTAVGDAAVRVVRTEVARAAVRLLSEIALRAERSSELELVGISLARLGQLADGLAAIKLEDQPPIFRLLQEGVIHAIAPKPANPSQAIFIQRAAANALVQVVRACPRSELVVGLLEEVRSRSYLEPLANALAAKIGDLPIDSTRVSGYYEKGGTWPM